MDELTTLFFGLYVGETDSELDAQIIAVFSSEGKAETFIELLKARSEEDGEELPDLYWDIRPIPFDPRTVSEVD